MANRISHSSSPYLRQHQENPVDWYPWGDEAFARAAAEDKPVFLSIGYSSCHWCHVMAHESFEDPEVAQALNAAFISVKVDREEQPDVDEAYMAAVQLASGRGGWPMSLFLTPNRRPFLAGTYMPRDGHGEHPGFLEVCRQITRTWRERRADVERVADQISEALAHMLGQPAPEASCAAFDQAFVDQGVAAVLGDFDPDNGGFGPAPKFPPHTSISFLLAYATETDGPMELRETAIEAAFFTLRQMSLGGIHDHVGGGFHRYSTDERWLLPHFEKMLYDNALMLANFGRASVLAEQIAPPLADRFRLAGAGIVDWLAREMTSSAGLFFAAIDADSAGPHGEPEEGSFYVWTEAETRTVLGEGGAEFIAAFGIESGGNFLEEATGHRTGTNVLHLKTDPGDRFEADLERLLVRRSDRPRPQTDEKALVAANGLMIGALSEVGMLPMAGRAADAILDAERRHGRLPHQIVDGLAAGDAFLDGYAYFADGLLRLALISEAFAADGEPPQLSRPPEEYRAEAVRLGAEMVARFYDESGGGFFFTAESHETIFGRSKPVLDQPAPSPNAVAVRVLLEVGDEERALRTQQVMLGWMERAPRAAGAMFEAFIPVLGQSELLGVEELPTSAVLPPVAAPAVLSASVEVSLSPREIAAGDDGYGLAEVLILVPVGMHLNSNAPPARWLTPTRVEVRPLSAEVSYPTTANDRFENEVRIPIRLRIPPGQSAAEFEVRVSYQACTESECLSPAERTFDAVILRR